jgi:flagellar hook assembly protein FlgD
VELAVYDVLGRRVRTLVAGDLQPRRYTRFWDGRDDSGTRVGSGVYFYRLKADGFEQVRKVTWVR